jgi:hypothetical protein
MITCILVAPEFSTSNSTNYKGILQKAWSCAAVYTRPAQTAPGRAVSCSCCPEPFDLDRKNFNLKDGHLYGADVFR